MKINKVIASEHCGKRHTIKSRNFLTKYFAQEYAEGNFLPNNQINLILIAHSMPITA